MLSKPFTMGLSRPTLRNWTKDVSGRKTRLSANWDKASLPPISNKNTNDYS